MAATAKDTAAAGGDAKGAPDFATDVPVEPVLERLEDFFSSPELTSAISDFMTEHSGRVEFRAPGDEQPMGNYDVFRQYSEVVENLLEDFLRRENIEMGVVAEACKRVQGSEAAHAVTCVDYLVAATEYNNFMLLAYDFASLSFGGDENTAFLLEDYDDVVEFEGLGREPGREQGEKEVVEN
mmetsp:Transcript_21920/g.54269  ORF Transcript_21920/g.54269 Transcript_21920/m.54269 type:complete len:182 (-) Transcript_21920:14-559(-)